MIPDYSKRISNFSNSKRELLEILLKKNDIETLVDQKIPELKPVVERKYYPVSYAQRRMYFLNHKDLLGTAYNSPQIYQIDGELDVMRLKNAFFKLTERHEILRTSFALHEGEVVQEVYKEINLAIDCIDINDNKENNYYLEKVFIDFVKPFDLNQAPLFRVKVVKESDTKYYLLIDIAHIISDYTSMAILMDEFVQIYEGRELAPLKIQYKDYAVWQNEVFNSGILKKQEEFWVKTFKDTISPNFYTDYPRPSEMDFKGDTYVFELSEDVTSELKKIAIRNNSTLFSLILATLNVLWSRFTGQEDVIVGAPVVSRNRSELQNMMGVFLNTLPLRNYPKAEKTFAEFLKEINQNLLNMFENQDFQFEMLLEKLNINRFAGRNPLFDINIDFLNFNDKSKLCSTGLRISSYPIQVNNTAKFDLEFFVVEEKDKLKFNCIFRTSIFKKSTIEYIMGEYQRLIREIIINIFKPLKDYCIFSPNNILKQENNIISTFEHQKFLLEETECSILKRFDEQVRKWPQKLAIKMGSKKLTYQDLNEEANKIADLLYKFTPSASEITDGFLESTSASKNQNTNFNTIALLFSHSVEMVIGILGVLRVGKIFVPLDSTYPLERMAYILEDAGCNFIITDAINKKLADNLIKIVKREIKVVCIEDLKDKNPGIKRKIDIKPGQIAYIIYTSGSTGKPKGVIQNHRNIMRFICHYTNQLQINSNDKLGLFTSFSHTVGIIDIFSALLYGATIYPYDLKTAGSIEKLGEWLKNEKITIIHTVPTVYRYFVKGLKADEKLPDVRLLIIGGETVYKSDVELYKKYFSDKCIFVNLFGSSEVLIATSYIINKETEVTNNTVPVGYPIQDVEVMLVNDNDEKVGVFEIGELVYKSDYLALGYWSLNEITKEKFRISSDQSRVFYSGDLGRLLPDGRIEYLGRKDYQVKINGNRVELTEIEVVLNNIQGIEESIVDVIKTIDGEMSIVAYYTTWGGFEKNVDDIRKICRQWLPEYMIPTYFIFLEQLPKTPNGKVDRQALPKIEKKNVGFMEPENEIEERLCEIWKEVLGVDKIDTNDNFFQIGGHSLKATTLISKIERLFNKKLSIQDVFTYPTIKELANKIQEQMSENILEITRVEEKDYYQLSAAQKRIYVLDQLQGANTSFNTPGVIFMEGKLDKKRLNDVFDLLIKRHESFRTSFELIDNEPMQKIHSEVNFKVEQIKSDEVNVKKDIINFIRPFNLNQAPLFRVGLIELSERNFVLVFDAHNIIADGTSIQILVKEFISLYYGKELPKLKVRYSDFAEWQNKLLMSGFFKEQEKFWLDMYQGEIPVSNLLTDYSRPLKMTYEGDCIKYVIEKDLTNRLNQLAFDTNTTLFMVLFAAFNVLLSKYTGQEDIIIGTLIAGRHNVDLENIIGMFVGTLAIRSYPCKEKTFNHFLREIKETMLKAYENQDYQFDMLLEKINLPRTLNRNPLFDVMFNMLNILEEKYNLITEDGLIFKREEFDNNVAKFDLELYLVEADNQLRINFVYRTKFFKRETIERLAKRYIDILEEVVGNPNLKLMDIEKFTEEKNNVLLDFNEEFKTNHIKILGE